VTARAALAAALAAACAAAAPARAPAVVADGRWAMGTVLEITLVADDEAAARELLDACFAEVAELERVFTTFDPASAVMELNRRAGAGPVPVDPRLARLLADALAFAGRTDGAFDPTVGPLVALWKEAGARGAPPSAGALAEARASVGYDQVRVADGAVALARPEMALDFGAVAKGWALDRLGERLAAAGVRDALLDFGGSSVLALGRPADAEAWALALPDGRGGFAGVVRLRDRALGVSGSLGQWSEIGGRRYGHVVDPRSGLALERSAQAAVIAPSAAAADAWSTALTVLGGEAGLALLAREPGAEALVLEEGAAPRATRGWAQASGFDQRP
jgi:thiamine biosynthesis lipoprotein